MNKAQNTAEIAEIADRFSRSACAVVTDFRGLNVESMTELRNEFRKVGVEYKVVKNKLIGLALNEEKYTSQLAPHLKEPTAIAWSYDDPAAPAKVVMAFAKKNAKLKVKCAILDGQVISESDVDALAKMPGKNELLASLLATFMAPATEFVRLLAAPATNFVYLLDARRRQLEEK